MTVSEYILWGKAQMLETGFDRMIHQLFIEKGWTLSLAESCTGGALAVRLTLQPGCSQYFLGSLVAYSNELKINLLGVDKQALQEKGAVSSEVTGQMAEGIRRLTNSTYSIAVSGIAGPGGGTPQKPVGTIWGAIASAHLPLYTWSFALSGHREDIIQKSVNRLLQQLWLLIKN